MYMVLTFVVETVCENALWSVKFSNRTYQNINLLAYHHKIGENRFFWMLLLIFKNSLCLLQIEVF